MLPTYNRPELILRAVKSVLEQERDNYLLHIFNDGSDVSYDRLEALISNHPNVIYTKSKNIGINESRNIMLDRFIKMHESDDLKNVYFCTLSDDDYFVEDAFKKFELSIKDYPTDVWFCFNCHSLSQHIFENSDFPSVELLAYHQFRSDYKGDKHFLFRLDELRENRYPAKFFKNGFEHIYYYAVPANMRIIPVTVKIIEYQEDGLSLSELYDSFDNFSVILAHIKSDPRNKIYYSWMLKKILRLPKTSLKQLVSEERYYKIKKRLGLKVPEKYK